MIVDAFSCAQQYNLGPVWDKILPELMEMLKNADTLEEGRYLLAGGPENGGAAAVVKMNTTKDRSEARYEAHERMADVQATLIGDEYLDMIPMVGGEIEEERFDDRDLIFYPDMPGGTAVHLTPGMFALVMPGEIHRPGVQGSVAQVKKLVVKIPADQLQAPSCTR